MSRLHSVRLLYDVPGWAYFYRCEGLRKYAPPDFEVSTGLGNNKGCPPWPHDLHLQLCYSLAPWLRQVLDSRGDRRTDGRKPVIVTGCNTGWTGEGPREGRHHYAAFDAASDWVVFNSRAAWGMAGKPPRSSWISNGVDCSIFNPRKPLKGRKPRVLWIGSMYHTRRDLDVKRYWAILMPLKERLEQRGIECDFRRIDSGGAVLGLMEYHRPAELAEWYSSGSVYVVASQSEGTPNPLLEASACGCVPVSTVVGNAPELIQHGANGLLCEPTVDAFEKAVLDALAHREQWAEAIQETIQSWHWGVRAGQYYELFRRLLSPDKEPIDELPQESYDLV